MASRIPLRSVVVNPDENGREVQQRCDTDNVSMLVGVDFLSSTMLSANTPHTPMRQDWRESAILGPTTLSKTFARFQFSDEELEKENETSFAVPSLPCHIRSSSVATRSPNETVMKRRAESVADVCRREEGASLRISPGTSASEQKMAKKLAALKKRDSRRREKLSERTASSQRGSVIDLTLTAQKFLHNTNSIPQSSPTVFHRTPQLQIENVAKFNRSQDVTDGTLIATATDIDVTYTVSKYQNGGVGTFSLANGTAADEVCDVEQRSLRHMEALTAWLNYLLKGDCDDENFQESAVRSKAEADRHLRELLTMDVNLKAARMKALDDVKGFNFKTFFADAKIATFRKRAQEIYRASDIPQKIVALVEEGKISVASDKKVFYHLGLQTKLLKLLLDFHPFWLRLGLETIFGTEIDIPTKEAFKSAIVMFIAQRLFRDPLVMSNRRYVVGRGKTIVTEAGEKMLLRHFLTKILQFLFIVEAARQDGELAQRRPRLFLRSSAVKSVADVLAVLSREVMSGSSNLPKALAKIGFKPKYKQGFFEEFQYFVKDFTTDLGDGIILGKAVELVAGLEPNSVIGCLRNPSGDRLRKIGNVNEVLNAASSHGIDIGGLKAERIVQGRVEDTLEFVWRLVGVFAAREYRLENNLRRESIRINASTRHSRYRSAPNDMSGSQLLLHVYRQLAEQFGIDQKLDDVGDLRDGVLLTQIWNEYVIGGRPLSSFNGDSLLQKLAHAAEEVLGVPSGLVSSSGAHVDSKSLSLFARIYLNCVLEWNRLSRAAIVIQKAYRCFALKKAISERVAANMQAEVHIRDDERCINAAIIVQRMVRGWIVRKRYQQLIRQKEQRVVDTHHAVIIQSYVRGILARRAFRELRAQKELERNTHAAIVLQSAIRGWLARRGYKRTLVERRLQLEQRAAVVIQSAVRGWLARRGYKRTLVERRLQLEQRAAVVIQSAVRGWLARRGYKRTLVERRLQLEQRAAVVIQCAIRGFITRCHFKRMLADYQRSIMENAATLIQKTFKGYLARCYMKSLRAQKEAEKHRMAIVIQKVVRRFIAKRLLERLRAQRKMERNNAAVVIQKAVKCFLVRRRLMHSMVRKAVQRNQAAVTLQRAIRHFLAKRYLQRLRSAKAQQNHAAVLIQSYVRRFLAYRLFIRLKVQKQKELNCATVVIQTWLRGLIAQRRAADMIIFGQCARDRELVGDEGIALKSSEDIPTTVVELSVGDAGDDSMIRKDYRDEVLAIYRRLKQLRREQKDLKAILRAYFRAVARRRAEKEAENKRRNQAAVRIQAAWRGYRSRMQHMEGLKKIAYGMARFHAQNITDEEREYRKKPIMDRVMELAPLLCSDDLYMRSCAANTLAEFTHYSEACALHVFNAGGIELILDSLDSSNRGFASVQVVTSLVVILSNLLKFESVKSQIGAERRLDMTSRCFHFWYAYRNSSTVVESVSHVLVILAGMDEHCRTYLKAPFYIKELRKRYASLGLSVADSRRRCLDKVESAYRVVGDTSACVTSSHA
uniref:Calponin-homology (CH) domain-containing protein n=2 Tax=Parascaris univalens TaxID=6257 RepID=A0A915BCJ1_PARUN